MTSNPCTIGLGSNCDDRENQIKKAIAHLELLLTDTKVSSVYESPAFNGKDKPYLNAVVHGFTTLPPEKLINELKTWEESQGRNNETRAAGIVPIDLDLVIYNYRILRQEDFERHYFNKGYRELLAQGAFVS